MIKRFFSIALMIIATLCAFSQTTPLKLNPNVKYGVLPNGLTYYILHNEEPKNRANFYIAQKVGSTLETPEQLGLAHFLEHMAFNGTKNYPGKNMLNYLQSKGITFGKDINAYTGFDETVYRIENVTASDKALMDSVLLCLYDWSCGILLEESEIDAERGVIEEEWRMRNNAQTRMYTSILPKIFSEYQYQQMPIGKMEIVKNFKPEVLREYYKKWYRPDQQGIVIVGDFNAADMEKKLKKLFSTIKMPENAAPREYPVVSNNEKPIYTYFEDKELQVPIVFISFKKDKMPFEQRNTKEYFFSNELEMNLFATMINNRLQEYSLKPECSYLQAAVYFGDYYVAKTKAAFNVTIVAKTDVEKSVKEAMDIVSQACKTGFLPSELSRAKDNLIASYEKAYNERDKQKSSTIANELIRNFIDNVPAMSVEAEYKLFKELLPLITIPEMNKLASTVLTDENQVVVVSTPLTPYENVITSMLQESINGNYDAYEDASVNEELIKELPKKGSISSVAENKELGISEMTLSNGAKVILKTTDFAKDEITVSAVRKGGLRTYDKSQADNLSFLDLAFEASKIGDFDVVKMMKYLTGKKVSTSFSMNGASSRIIGRSTVKDFKTLMELLYGTFTMMNPDETMYQSMMSQQKAAMINQEKNPQNYFFKKVNEYRFGGNPLLTSATVEELEKASYPDMLNIIKESMNNAADYTFVVTGNIDAATLKPYLEQYIASLPSKGVAVERPIVSDLGYAKGIVKEDFQHKMGSPVTYVFNQLSGDNLKYNIDDLVKIKLTSDVLQIIFTNTLREEEGGTYSASASSSISDYDDLWSLIYFFTTNADMKDAMVKRAYDETMKLLNDGASEGDFAKVKEAAIKDYENRIRTNSYWTSSLNTYALGKNIITGHLNAIESLNRDDLNKFMKNLYNGQNRVEVVMDGVKE